MSIEWVEICPACGEERDSDECDECGEFCASCREGCNCELAEYLPVSFVEASPCDCWMNDTWACREARELAQKKLKAYEAAMRSGANEDWREFDRWTLRLDAHRSDAEQFENHLIEAGVLEEWRDEARAWRGIARAMA